MKHNAEKRAGERHGYPADIAFSYFNKKQSYHAEIMNLGMGGMCFKSNLALQPGATICVRFIKKNPDDSGTGSCEGIRLVAVADVKWCSEIPGISPLSYGVGVKYYGPVY